MNSGRPLNAVLPPPSSAFGGAKPSTADSSSAPPPGRRTEKVQSVGVRLWTSFEVMSMYECTSVGAASVSTTVDEWAVL